MLTLATKFAKAAEKYTDQRRAKKGGETGANGEWYPGGSFINTSADKSKKPIPSKGGGKGGGEKGDGTGPPKPKRAKRTPDLIPFGKKYGGKSLDDVDDPGYFQWAWEQSWFRDSDKYADFRAELERRGMGPSKAADANAQLARDRSKIESTIIGYYHDHGRAMDSEFIAAAWDQLYSRTIDNPGPAQTWQDVMEYVRAGVRPSEDDLGAVYDGGEMKAWQAKRLLEESGGVSQDEAAALLGGRRKIPAIEAVDIALDQQAKRRKYLDAQIAPGKTLRQYFDGALGEAEDGPQTQQKLFRRAGLVSRFARAFDESKVNRDHGRFATKPGGESRPVYPKDLSPGDSIPDLEYGKLIIESINAYDPKYPRSQTVETNRGRRDFDPDRPLTATAPDHEETFRQWFGKSKVVDEHGEPLRVFHGTTAAFNEFDSAKLGSHTGHRTSSMGFFFSGADNAGGFTEDLWGEHKQGAALVPAYLSIRNPVKISARDFSQRFVEGKRDSPQAFVEAAKQAGYDGVEIEADSDYASQPNKGEYAETTYIVFDPHQIKSASGNRGTFDPSDPDIRHSRSGLVSRFARAFDESQVNRDPEGQFAVTAATNIDGGKIPGYFDIERDGERVGTASLASDFDTGQARPFLDLIKLDDEHQRSGQSQQIYDAIEAATGQKLVPSPLQRSEAADRIWVKRLAAMSSEDAANVIAEAKRQGESYNQPADEIAAHLDPLIAQADKARGEPARPGPKFTGYSTDPAEEFAAIDRFLDQFDDPLKAARAGQIEPDESAYKDRDEEFAKWFNGQHAHYKTTQKSNSGIPETRIRTLKRQGIELPPGHHIEHAELAIAIGQALGYRPEDIAHYLVQNYLPFGDYMLGGGGAWQIKGHSMKTPALLKGKGYSRTGLVEKFAAAFDESKHPRAKDGKFGEGGGKYLDPGGKYPAPESPRGKSNEPRGKSSATPEFRQWFGKSKVVDEHGEPLRVFHGTGADIDAFDANKIGRANDAGYYGWGFYFTADENLGRTFARMQGTDKPMAVYISLQNPLIIETDSGGSARDAMRDLGYDIKHPKAVTSKLLDDGYDGVIVKRGGDSIFGKKGDMLEIMVADDSWDTGGYDLETRTPTKRTPRQADANTKIKSVDNRGTWDGSDGRLSHSRQGLVERFARAFKESDVNRDKGMFAEKPGDDTEVEDYPETNENGDRYASPADNAIWNERIEGLSEEPVDLGGYGRVVGVVSPSGRAGYFDRADMEHSHWFAEGTGDAEWIAVEDSGWLTMRRGEAGEWWIRGPIRRRAIRSIRAWAETLPKEYYNDTVMIAMDLKNGNRWQTDDEKTTIAELLAGDVRAYARDGLRSRFARSFSKYDRQMSLWNEDDHPRGQPDNPGQFAESNTEGDNVQGEQPTEAPLGGTDSGPTDDASDEAQRLAEAAEQWRRLGVRSGNFKRWFGDWEQDPQNSSKVVDPETGEPKETYEVEGSQVVGDDGQPVMVYHGTAGGDFEAFDPSRVDENALYGAGFYFSEDMSVAKDYMKKDQTFEYKTTGGSYADKVEKAGKEIRRRIQARLDDPTRPDGPGYYNKADLMGLAPKHKTDSALGIEMGRPLFASVMRDWGVEIDDLWGPSDTAHVHHVYLNIRKPFDVEAQVDHRKIADKFRELLAGGLTNAKAYHLLPGRSEKELRESLEEYIDGSENSRIGTIKGDHAYQWMREELGAVATTRILKELGYDGITHTGGVVSGGKAHKVWIAFDPGQIKSASYLSAGTFDPSDPRMKHSRQSLVERFAKAFVESEHPRAADGKWGDKGGGAAVAEAPDRLSPLDQAVNLTSWFGDSKVIDDDGYPLRVFHGTAVEFDETRGMFWASTSPDLAGDYSHMRKELSGGPEQIMPVYLAIERPLDADKMSKTMSVGAFFSEALAQAQEDDRKIPLAAVAELMRTIKAGAREEGSGPYYSRHDFWYLPHWKFGSEGGPAIMEALKLLGFDGVTMMEKETRTYGAFDSTQVKSASGNRGTFDTSGKIKNRRPGLVERFAKAFVESEHPRAADGKWSTAGSSGYKENLTDWGKGSEAVDSSGELLTLYHGTRGEISEFDPEKLGSYTGANSAKKAFFFTDEPDVASSYPDGLHEVNEANRATMPGPMGVPASLEYRLPQAEAALERAEAATAEAAKGDDGWEVQITEIDQFGHAYTYDDGMVYDDEIDARDAAYEAEEKIIDEAQAQVEKMQQREDDDRIEASTGANVMPVHLSLKNPLVYDFAGGGYQEKSFSELIDEAIEDGHDGVIMENVSDAALGDIESTVYAVFSPEQIKSASGNRGTFDASGKIKNRRPGLVERFAKAFVEADHPRQADGKWGDKGGAAVAEKPGSMFASLGDDYEEEDSAITAPWETFPEWDQYMHPSPIMDPESDDGPKERSLWRSIERDFKAGVVLGMITPNGEPAYSHASVEHWDIFREIGYRVEPMHSATKAGFITFRRYGAGPKIGKVPAVRASWWLRVGKLDESTIEKITDWAATLPDDIRNAKVKLDVDLHESQYTPARTITLDNLGDKALAGLYRQTQAYRRPGLVSRFAAAFDESKVNRDKGQFATKPGTGKSEQAEKPGGSVFDHNLSDDQHWAIIEWMEKMVGKTTGGGAIEAAGVGPEFKITPDDRETILEHLGLSADELRESKNREPNKMQGLRYFLWGVAAAMGKNSDNARGEAGEKRALGARVVALINKETNWRLILHPAVRADKTSDWQLSNLESTGIPIGHTNPPSFKEVLRRALGVGKDGYWNERGYEIEWTDKDQKPAPYSRAGLVDRFAAAFDESKVNRDKGGQFATKEGGGSGGAKPGRSYFSDKALETAERESSSYATDERVIEMTPDDFLKMAAHVGTPEQEKVDRIKGLIDKGVGFNDVPFLTFKHNAKGTARVAGHEGRHRAMALRDAGVEQMPVRLVSVGSQAIKWNDQGPGESNDFYRVEGEWPTALHGETNGHIPFPVDDQRVVSSRDRSANLATAMKGSKVVDKNGDPLRVFHGSLHEIKGGVFHPERTNESAMFGKGIYFASSAEDSNRYATTNVSDPDTTTNPDMIGKAEQLASDVGISYREAKEALSKGATPNVTPAYLSIKKPLEIGHNKVSIPRAQFILAASEIGKTPDEAAKLFKRFSELTGKRQFEHLQQESATQIYGRIVSMTGGYDGIILHEDLTPHGAGAHYVAMSSEQVFSSSGNRGTFDPKDPNINHRRPGIVEKFNREFYAHKPAPGQSTMWDEEEHPREAGGEFAEKEGGVAVEEPPEAKPEAEIDTIQRAHQKRLASERLDIGLANAVFNDQITKEQAAKYNAAYNDVFDRMTPEALERVHKNTKGAEFFGNFWNLMKSIYGETTGKKLIDDGVMVGGAWSHPEGHGEGSLTLDGGGDTGQETDQITAELYAHEFGHALDADPGSTTSSVAFGGLDYKSSKLSDTDEWKTAWEKEINADIDLRRDIFAEAPLSRYATDSASEGFAEFARLVYQPHDSDEAKKKFPKCWAFWKSKGLI